VQQDKQDDYLRSASAWQRKIPPPAVKLGDLVQDYLKKDLGSISSNALLADVWEELLPDQLQSHCSFVGLKNGTLRIAVEPGPYMHRLGQYKEILLQQIHQRCRGLRVNKIVLTVWNKKQETENSKPQDET